MLSNGDTHETKHYLYTVPNKNGTFQSQENTKLVLKGTWNDGTEDRTCYYSIDLGNINNDGTMSEDFKQYPNRNYIVDVVIKREGAPDSKSALVQSQQTHMSVTSVEDWDGVAKDTEFNGAGGTPQES